MSFYSNHIFVCTNQKEPGKKCCADSAGNEYFNYLKTRLLELELFGPGRIRVSKSGCLGRCSLGPCIVIYPEGIWYTCKSFEDIDQIIESHIQQGVLVQRLMLPI